MAQLPDLHVSDSSEAMLSGRKPPFRLLVRAVATDGRKVNIRHAVSEGFVVRLSYSFQPFPMSKLCCLIDPSTWRHERGPSMETLTRSMVRKDAVVSSFKAPRQLHGCDLELALASCVLWWS